MNTDEQKIHLIDFKVDNMEYKNMLLLSSLDQLKFYHDIKQKRCENDYSNVLTTHLSDKGRCDLFETAIHYAEEGMTKASMFSGGNAFEIELKMHSLLSDQYRLQAVKIIENNQIVINSKGGYHWRKLENCEITNDIILSNIEVKEFIYGKYKKNIEINGLECEFYFVLDKNGKIYFDTCVYRHDVICDTYSLNCDDVIKLMYYTKNNNKHRLFKEYGISGLRLSVVYEHVTEPFIVKDTHLKAVENFIKKIETKKGG